MGLLAYLLTLHETGSHVLAGLAFSIGFIALFLAHSELFTEGFYYPIMAVVNRRGSWLELLRLWGVTLAMNLVGGWLTVGLIAAGFPKLHDTLGESAHHFLDIGMSWQGAALAVLAGVKGVGYAEWPGWVWWVIPLNILGGLFFTTLPRVLRSVEVREQEDL